jgi:hypothetical protein
MGVFASANNSFFWALLPILTFWGVLLVITELWKACLKAYNDSQDKRAAQTSLCPHGLAGGRTLALCNECRKDSALAQERWEVEMQEKEKKAYIKRKSEMLRMEEFRRLSSIRLQKLDFLRAGTPRDFEAIVCELFARRGFVVTQTPYTNDGGKDGIAIKATIWDTAGEERFKSLTNIYYKGARGALLVYDSSDEESFYSLKNYLDRIRDHSTNGVVILLIGNKNDLLE